MSVSFSRGATKWASSPTTADGSIIGTTYSSSFNIITTVWLSSTGATPISGTSLDQSKLLPGTYTLRLTDSNYYQYSCAFTIGYVGPKTLAYSKTISSSTDTTFGGYTVSDGSYVAVYSSVLTTQYGSVSIYKNTMPGFVLTQTITQPTQIANALFGSAMAIQGDTLFIGCQYAGTPGVYVYKRGAGTEVWTQAQLLPVQDAQGAVFSTTIAISGTNAVIGGSTYAYIYTYNGTTWTPTITIAPVTNQYSYGTLCFSLDLVGSTLAIQTDNNALYIFTFTSSAYTQVYGNVFYGAYYYGGSGVALSGDATSCIVGAGSYTAYSYPNGTNDYYQSGVAYVVSLRSGSWIPQPNLYFGQDIYANHFGTTVCRSGNDVWIGSLYGINVYTLVSGSWQIKYRVPLAATGSLKAGSTFVINSSPSLGVIIMPQSSYLMTTTNTVVNNCSVVNTATGSITLTPQNALGPFAYSWSSSRVPVYFGIIASNVTTASGPSLTALYAGLYSAQITDGYGLRTSTTCTVNQMLLTKGNVYPSGTPLAAGSQQTGNYQVAYKHDPSVSGYLTTSYTQIGTIVIPWDYTSSNLTGVVINSQWGTYSSNTSTYVLKYGNIRFGNSPSTLITPWSCVPQYIANSVAASAAFVTSFQNAGFAPYQTVPIYANWTTQVPTDIMTYLIQLSYSVNALGSGSIQASSVSYGSGSYNISWLSSPGARDVSADKDAGAISLVSPGSYTVSVNDALNPGSIVTANFQVPSNLPAVTAIVTYIPGFYGMTDTDVSTITTDGVWIVGAQPQNARRQIPYTQSYQTLGALYIVKASATSLSNVATLNGSTYNGNLGNVQLGRAVAVGYNTIAASDFYPNVNIFTYTGSSWPFSPNQTIGYNSIVSSIAFWSSTSIFVASGTTVNAITNSGGTWSSVATPVVSGPTDQSWGQSMAVDSNYLAIGAPSGSGSVYIYKIANNIGTQLIQLKAPDASSTDYFGSTISMANGSLVVGAPGWNVQISVYNRPGCVYVYKRSGDVFTPVQQLTTPRPLSNTSYAFGYWLQLTPTASYLTVNGIVYVQSADGSYKQLYDAATDTFPAVTVGTQLISANTFQTMNLYNIADTSLTVAPGAVGAGTIGTTSIYGGKPPYIISWTGLTSTTADPKSNLNVGTYKITVKDSATTPATQSVTYTVTIPPPGPAITPGAVTNISIYGQTTGAIGLATLGVTVQPYTYLWTSSNGGSVVRNPTALEAKTGLSAGTYTFKVTDANNHISSFVYTITQAAQLVVSGGTVNNASQPGAADGSVSGVTIAGGVSPYTYAWTGGSLTVINSTIGPVTSLAKGVYAVKVTDAAGVVVTTTYTVLENQVLGLTGGSITNVLINGAATGAISAVTASGGSGVYTYAWSNSVGASTISTSTTASAKSSLLAGTYTLAITDGRSVSLTSRFVVTQNSAIVTTGGVATNPNGAANGQISQIVAVGGVAPYTVAWTQSAGATTTPSPTTLYAKQFLLSGTYTCVITDSVGATKTLTYTLVDVYVAMASTRGTITHATFYSASNASVTPTLVTGGALPYTYNWTATGARPSAISGVHTFSLTNVQAGNYTLTVIDATGRTVAQTYAIGEPIQLSEVHTDITSTVPTGSITVTPVGGLGSYSYAWTKNGTAIPNTTAAISGLTIGSYVCTVTTSLFFASIAVDVATYMTTTVASNTVRLQWGAITNAASYMVYYSPPGTPMVNKTLYNANTQANSMIINGLTPATTYVMEVYSTTDNINYKRSYASTVTTLAASSLVFNKILLQNGTTYDITKLQDVDTTQQTALTAKIVNANFSTSDTALSYATVNNDTQKVNTTIVQLNYSIQVGKNSTIYLPFDSGNTAAQTVTLILQDSSTVIISYTQATNSIYVAGQSLTPGSTFSLDNQAVTVAAAK